MRNADRVICRIGFAALMATMFMTNAQSHEVTLATSADYKPYTVMVEKLFRDAGFTAVTTTYPMERALYLAERGDVDGVFFRTKAAFAGKKKYNFVGPVGCADVSAFFLKDHKIVISSANDLSRYKVAVQRGDKLAEEFLAKRKIVPTLVIEDDSLMKILKAGRVDIVMAPKSSGIVAAGNLSMLDDIDTAVTVAVAPLYIVLAKPTNEMVGRLDKAFSEMKKSGDYARDVGAINQSMSLPKAFGVECPAE